jgi:hypothetical protein
MNPDAKLVMYCLVGLILIGPLAFWAALRLTVSLGCSVTAKTLALIKTLRWAAWISALVLIVLYLAGVLRREAWPLAAALGGCSAGLALPLSWAKERIARKVSP